jgi:hypothetical protein
MVDWTPHIIAALLITAACTALLRQQYNTRSVRRSAVTGIAGLCLAALAAAVFPWKVFVPRQIVPEWAGATSAAMLSVDPTSAQFNGSRSQPLSWAVADAEAYLGGVPSGWYATARLRQATLDVAGKPRLISPSYGYSASLTEPQDPESPLTRVLRNALGVVNISPPGTPNLSRVFLMVCQQAEIEQRRGLTATYDGDFVVDLTKIESAGTLPLTGGVFQDRDFRLVVDAPAAPTVTRGFELSARISRSGSMFDRRPPTEYLYFLRNRARDHAVSGFINSAPAMNPLGSLPIAWLRSPFAVRAATLWFDVPRDRENSRKPDLTWLADAELVVVRATAVGSVGRQMHIDSLIVDPDRAVTSKRRQLQ